VTNGIGLAPRGLERHPGGLAPGQRVPGVVDLVEQHQGPAAERALPVECGMSRDLRVCDGYAGEIRRGPPLGVAELRVQRDSQLVRRLRPLMLEVLGRRDNGDGRDLAAGEQFGRDCEGERRLAGARRRHQQEVALIAAKVSLVGVILPAAECEQQFWPDWLMGAPGVITGGGCGDGHRSERLPAAADSSRERHDGSWTRAPANQAWRARCLNRVPGC
jgi:hypothetical protein